MSDESTATRESTDGPSIDPVCGMTVTDDTHTFEHEGTTYRFCSDGCRAKFESEPEKHLSGAPGDGSKSIADYAPLFVLIGVTAASAAALRLAPGAEFTWHAWMADFMGFFLVVFSMVKLFDLPGFAKGFAKYDLLAGRVRGYAFVYPFIEGALGLGYLARFEPRLVYGATFVVLGFGALGVFRSIARGENLSCVCMGSVLDVPLSTVTLVEDLGMAGMAAVMWFAP